MQGLRKINIILKLVLFLVPVNSFATNYLVTLTSDSNPTGGGNSGDLRYALTQLATTGTTGEGAGNNNIYVQVPSGTTINVGAANLPTVTNGVTICYSTNGTSCASSGSGQFTISGALATASTTPTASLISTIDASVSLTNVALQYGLAQGGAGATVSGGGGGGGGLGAGGGIYIDAGEQLTLTNVSINNCSATGGAGGNGGTSTSSQGGGGGGASWSMTTSDASGGTGGGDQPGGNPSPTITTFTVLSGYGGGAGGTGGGSAGSGGSGGGNSFGQPSTSGNTATTGGAGGYCGGGGGAGQNGGGGGGGNPGGYGNVVSGTTGGGAGGSYGSGGGGGSQSPGLNSANGGGGGGGYGGGGGGAGGTSLSSAGGGGGGFGGGGGGGGISASPSSSAGIAGNYGGNGGAGVQAAAGGGGAGIGGGIYVGDSAVLYINDGVSIPTGSNTVTGGLAGTSGGGAVDGTGYATDIFLFQNASVQFTGTDGYTTSSPFGTAIQSDQTTGAVADGGILINTTTTTTVIALSSTLNNFFGPTNIQQGILVVGASNLSPNSNINIQSSGALYLTSAYSPTVSITNAGALNITNGIFTVPTNFTNTGGLYVVGTGDISGSIASGSSLSIGQTSNGLVLANNFTATGAINVTAVNVYTGSTLTTAGGTVSANLYMLGNSTFTNGSPGDITGTMLTTGIDSFGNTDATTAFVATQAIDSTDFATININTGTFANNGFAITPTSINVYNSASLISTGLGPVTANLYMLGASTFTGTVTGDSLNVGVDSFGNTNTSTVFNLNQAVTAFPSLNVVAGTFSTNGFTISNLDTAFTISSGAVATLDASVTGSAPLNNSGTLNNSAANALGITGLITNTDTINITQPLVLSNTINNAATIAVSTGVNFTSNNDMYLYNNATVSGNVTGGAGSSITIGQDSLGNTYSATNATISASLTNIPALNVLSGSLTATGTITGLDNTFNIASGSTAAFSGDVTGTVAAINAGTLTTYAAINVTSYTSTGNTNFVITNAATVGQINTTGAIDFGANTIGVSSNFEEAIANNTYNWTIAQGASVSPSPVNYSIPQDTIANAWTLTQDATSLSVQLVKSALEPNNPIIGPVIYEMSLDPENAAQFALINALGDALTQTDLDNFINELIPELNTPSINVRKQDVVFNQIWQRISAIRTNVAMHNQHGVAAGDMTRTKSAWLGIFASQADQQPFDNNFGYRAYSGGAILGIDKRICERNLIGIAGARSSTNVETKVDPGLNTRTIGYHVLLYGNHDYGRMYQYFLEWMVSTAYNENTSNKRILITGNNFSTNANYRDWQGGAALNFGRVCRYNYCLNLNPKASMQYNFIDIHPYSEEGGSPAALYVANNRWRDTLTLAVGGEMAFRVDKPYFSGRPSLTAMLGYDVISTKEITTASFLSGGGLFTYVSAPSRTSFTLGIDCTFEMNSYTEIQILYDLQLRHGYVSNAGTIKLRIFF